MVSLGTPERPLTIRRWLSSTPRRTFVLYPVLILAAEYMIWGHHIRFEPVGLTLLALGYAQYRLSGRYRTKVGGGGPGLDKPPQRLVVTGIYAYLRNPMYLGHLIFMAGMAVTFRSFVALAVLVFHCWWFNRRAVADEAFMRQRFDEQFEKYAGTVKRWGVF